MQQTKHSAAEKATSTSASTAVNPWLVMVALSFGMFISLSNSTGANIALTSIQHTLNTDLTTASWVINAYNLGFAVLLIPAGRLADQFGRKRFFMLGMAIFGMGSLMAALSNSIDWLITFRVVQSVGAALINAVSLALITYSFPLAQRGAAIGTWGAIVGASAAIGPLQGGLLVSLFNWQAIFFANLPFCVIGLGMVAWLVRESRDPEATLRIDFIGILVLTGSLLCLMLGIIEGNDWGWGSPTILGLFAGAVMLLLIFIPVELRQREPLIDLRLFQIRSFSLASISSLLFGIAIQGGFLIYVLYFTGLRGLNTLQAAYAITAMPCGEILSSMIYSRLSSRISSKTLMIAAHIIMSSGFLLLATMPENPTFFETTWRALWLGLSVGTGLSSQPNVALREISVNQSGVGSGIFSTARQVGLTLGVAILVSFLSGQGAIQHGLQAFRATWLLATGIGLLGIVPALFIHTGFKKNKS